MRFILQGARLVFGQKAFRRYLWQPFFASCGIFALTLLGGYLALLPLVSYASHRVGISSIASVPIATMLYLLFWWFFATAIYLSLAGFASSWLWGKLSFEVELRANANPPSMRSSFLADAPLRLMFSLLIAILIFLTGCFGLVPAVLLAGWLGLYDYTSSFFLRRGAAFPKQFWRALKVRGWPGFALGCGFIALVPVLNVIMFPALVAGGTLMCSDSVE